MIYHLVFIVPIRLYAVDVVRYLNKSYFTYYTYTTDHFYNISYARIPQTGITVNRGTRKMTLYCNFNVTCQYPILFVMVKMIIPNTP
jgi:hypothetical protein